MRNKLVDAVQIKMTMNQENSIDDDGFDEFIHLSNEWRSERKRNTYTDDNWMTSIEVERSKTNDLTPE